MAAFDSYSSDDDEDKCPLCIEDMDITDKNFKPCPCGFQICQFCYNNIRSGPDQYNRCPACRRPYDDESIEYKTLTAEDMKLEQERKQRKEQVRKQREREKNKDFQHHHFDQRDKKHLANVRVIQKNLVYVIGLNPNIPSEDLQQMLRRDEYFGQYGKIQKIVVNKRVNGNGNLGVGVYVTFARKEDAARCIAAVDGSINDGKYLRAAYGTTKYCSSYLRGQNCPNQNCMFLHEPGEEADSFNRHPNHLSSQGQQGQQPSGPQPSGPQPSGPQSVGTPSASASPVSVHSNLSTHTSAGAASSIPLSQGASTAVSPSAASSTAAQLPAGGMLTAANVPALPAWGKVTTQIPPVHKLTEHDLPDPAADSLDLLEKNLASLSTESWDFQFVSEILDTDAKFPAMFSLPMDDKRRLKLYNKALSDLDKLLPTASSPELKSRQESIISQEGDSRFGTSPPASSDPKAEAKKNNSQHLLAHLMRGVSPASSQPNRQDEDNTDYRNESQILTTSDKSENVHSEESRQGSGVIGDGSKEPLKEKHYMESEKEPIRKQSRDSDSISTSAAEPVSPPRLDYNGANNLLERFQFSNDQLHGVVADTLRQVGSDLMQPPAPVDVKVPEDIDVGSAHLADDGPTFDLKNLPQVPIVGDTAPSVWSAVEELSRQRDLFSRREKEFVASKAQTKKRLKRIRV